MRLQHYLLREARVKQTNADVFLTRFAPVFMYNSEVGLLWAVNPTMKSDIWELHKNGNLVGDYVSNFGGGMAITHGAIARFFSNNDQDFIRGRINPNGSEIFIHDLYSRSYRGMDKKRYDRLVNKAVDAVYRYMKDYIK